VFSVPIRNESPTLTLDAIPVLSSAPSGLSAVQVTSGTPVLFNPVATGDPHIQVTGWEWTPSDPMATPQSVECGPTDGDCTVPVVQDGRMKVTAIVDGQSREATAPVGLLPPELQVSANPTRILPNTAVDFDATGVGGGITGITWRWNPDSATGVTTACINGSVSCTVAVQESGWMVASAQVGGVACADSAHVDVVCDFFAAPQDSLLSNPDLQYIFAREWALSAPGDTLNAVERGGYIIERNGRYEFYPFPTSAGASACGFPPHDVDAFETHLGNDGSLVAVFHTHPLSNDTVGNNGLCPEFGSLVLGFKSGPSEEDFTQAAYLKSTGQAARFFAIEDSFVYEFDATFIDGRTGKALGGTNHPLSRDPACRLK
jgi:hypothetical protein